MASPVSGIGDVSVVLKSGDNLLRLGGIHGNRGFREIARFGRHGYDFCLGSDWDDALTLSKTAIALSNADLESRTINVDVQSQVLGPRGFQSCWAGSPREDSGRNNPSAGAPDTNCRLLHDTCWEQ